MSHAMVIPDSNNIAGSPAFLPFMGQKDPLLWGIAPPPMVISALNIAIVVRGSIIINFRWIIEGILLVTIFKYSNS